MRNKLFLFEKKSMKWIEKLDGIKKNFTTISLCFFPRKTQKQFQFAENLSEHEMDDENKFLTN